MEMTGWTTESFASSSGIGRNRAKWENKTSMRYFMSIETLITVIKFDTNI